MPKWLNVLITALVAAVFAATVTYLASSWVAAPGGVSLEGVETIRGLSLFVGIAAAFLVVMVKNNM